MFEIYDPAGNLQFDGIDSVYSLKSKVVVNSSGLDTTNYFPMQGYVYTLTVSNVIAPFVAWRNTSAGTANGLSLIKATYSGSNITYTFIGTTNASMTFYVFDYTNIAVSPSNFGVALYNGSAVLVYDAVNSRPLKLVQVATISGGGAPTTVSVPAGKIYATGFFEPGSWITNQSSFDFLVYYGRASASTTQASIGTALYIFEDGSLADAGIATIGGILDVTAY